MSYHNHKLSLLQNRRWNKAVLGRRIAPVFVLSGPNALFQLRQYLLIESRLFLIFCNYHSLVGCLCGALLAKFLGIPLSIAFLFQYRVKGARQTTNPCLTSSFISKWADFRFRSHCSCLFTERIFYHPLTFSMYLKLWSLHDYLIMSHSVQCLGHVNETHVYLFIPFHSFFSRHSYR